ncbi:MAG: acetyl ornithine aminotransferase family protein [Chloroflexi bacterium]|nr:acetyl ornithine aminotransferase family protein [Chloroflexota bacterium]
MRGESTAVNGLHKPLGPNAEAIIQRDHRVTSSAYTRGYPLVVERARGAHVWDVDGNEFLDFMAGIAVASTGHAHPQVVKAIQEQADKFLHICLSDFYYDVGVQLAEKLNAIAPFKENARVFFTNSGTETIEAAIKLARHATGRKRFIAFHGGFHGRTMGSLALTASKTTQQAAFFPVMPGAHHAPYPNPFRPVLNTRPGEDQGEAVVRYIEEVLFKKQVPADQVAAIFVEPIQGEGGYIVPPRSFLPALRALCDRHGILLVADEIQSGVGRTGRWWAVEHFGVEPDIVCSAKGLASGMPLGALIARESVMSWQPGSHGSTFGGNPVCCAAAVATLDVIENGLMQNAAQVGGYLMQHALELAARHDCIVDVRGKGLMLGLEIADTTGEPVPELRNRIVDEAFHEGLLLLGAGESVLRLMPPLMIDEATVDTAVTRMEAAFNRAEAAFG